MMGRNGKETLSSLHRKKMEDIEALEATLPDLQKERERLMLLMQSDSPVERRDSELALKDLDKEIERVSNERLNYLRQNSELLFRFTECEGQKTRKIYTMEDIKSRRSAVYRKDVSEKHTYYQRFRSNVDPEYVYAPENAINEENYCFECDLFRVLHADEATMVCEGCGSQITTSTNPERPSAKEPPNETHYYQYKRYTHFCDCLANLQGKESSVVPQPVIDTVIREITKVRMEHRVDELTEDDIRDFLKKHSDKNYDRYYDHATQILFKITKIQPIQMTPEMEHNLKVMFIEIQEPFELYKNSRRNFSSYSYIIYKFCQLLGYDEFLPKLKLHKNYQKLHEHDMIWKKICQYMGGTEKGWQFIKSYEY